MMAESAFTLILIFLLSLLLPDWASGKEGLTPIEEEYLGFPSGARAFEHLAFYTSRPHVAGTPGSYDTALYTHESFKRSGLQSSLISHDVTLSYPISRSLSITFPESLRFQAKLQEAAIPEDPTSSDPRFIMTYLAYSASGNVTADVIYVNFGRLEDFQELDRQGIDVRGKICIARYGNIFRGNKAFFAEMWGAAGLIIYSDPADDGYTRGTVYPEGPWRPETSVQRGSCLFLSICPGDPGKPLRCGNVEKIKPSIPLLPISYEDALPILSGLSGNSVPDSWKGGLPITYRFGPGPVQVNLNVEMQEERRTIWNVIGEIPGKDESDRKILLGNHRDSWNPGGLDPNSGTSIMLEVARGMGELLKTGWRPRRTIQFASWDAEEFGLIGSVEWGEENSVSLKKEAIAYINVDVGASGSNLGAGASPTLSNLIRDRTKYVIDPKSGKPLSEVWSGNVNPLGSGSDFAVFIEFLGIASIDIAFSGSYGVYHSIYDSLTYVQTISDPGFKYHQAMAQLWGLLALRLADEHVINFDYLELSKELSKYTDQIVEKAENAGGSIDVSSLRRAIFVLDQQAQKITQEREECLSTLSCNATLLRTINDRLAFAERRLTNQDGLPNRPWYKNLIFAPGYETGYAADSFPGVVDAIRDRNWQLAQNEVDRIATAVSLAAEFLATGQ